MAMVALKLLLLASLAMLPFMEHPPRLGLGSEEHCTIPDRHSHPSKLGLSHVCNSKIQKPPPNTLQPQTKHFCLNYFGSKTCLYSIPLAP